MVAGVRAGGPTRPRDESRACAGNHRVMQSRLLRTADGQRTFVAILDTGDEAFRDVTDFARRESIDAASLTAIGAFERAVLGFYDLDRREYDRLRVDEQVEVVSLVGDL